MTAAAPDHHAIVRVVQLYVDGFNGLGAEKFREAFHEDAWIAWATPPPDGRKVTGRIISVTQAGDVANVLLGFDDSRGKARSWVDSHSLLRIDGVWKITNKTATHSSRAGGA
jgi:hypothetical protein